MFFTSNTQLLLVISCLNLFVQSGCLGKNKGTATASGSTSAISDPEVSSSSSGSSVGSSSSLPALTSAADAVDVLSGKEFIDATGAKVTGTMTSRGALDATLTFPGEGFYSSIASTPTSNQICSGNTILGITGAASCGGSCSLPTLSTEAAAANVLSGKEFLDGTGTKVTGSMVSRGSLTLASSFPGAGYYSGISANPTASTVCSGITLLGVAGSATCGGVILPSLSTEAAAGSVLSGSEYINASGSKVTGTMASRGILTLASSFPGAGYYSALSANPLAGTICTGTSILGVAGSATCGGITPSALDLSSTTLNFTSSQTTKTLSFTNSSSTPAGATLSLSGAYGSAFSLSKTGVAASPTSPDSVTVTRIGTGGGTEGTTITATLTADKTDGSSAAVSISAVLPLTLGGLAISEGATHLFDFDSSNANWYKDKIATSGPHLTVGSGASSASSSFVATKGAMAITHAAAATSTSLVMDSTYSRDTNRTYELVFRVDTNDSGAFAVLWGTGSGGTPYGDDNFFLGISAATTVDILKQYFTSMSSIASVASAYNSGTPKLIYVSVGFDVTNSLMNISTRIQGGTTVSSTYSRSAGTSLNGKSILFGGDGGNYYTRGARYYHFAVYDKLLSNTEIGERATALGW